MGSYHILKSYAVVEQYHDSDTAGVNAGGATTAMISLGDAGLGDEPAHHGGDDSRTRKHDLAGGGG